MHIKRFSLVTAIMILALALSLPVLAQTPRYALATSSNYLYMLGTNAGWGANHDQNTKKMQIRFGDGPVATGLTGIAVRGDYAYVADAATDKLYVLKMKDFDTNPSFDVVNAVSLSQGANSLTNPGSVVVDESGDVYVIDSSSQIDANGHYSTYAVIGRDVIDPSYDITVNVTRVRNAIFDGIAVTPNGAIITQRNLASGYLGETWVSSIPSRDGDPTRLNSDPLGDTVNFYPVGVAVNGSIAYIANSAGSSIINEEHGSLSLFNTDTWSKMGTTIPFGDDNFIPAAITAFTKVSPNNDLTNYLVIMGSGDYLTQKNVQQAWLYTLDASGNLGVVEKALLDAVDYSMAHKCAVSQDGEVFWFTNQQAKTVGAWDTTDWGTDVGTFVAVEDALGNIVAYEYVAVPEPAGLVALLSFTAGLAGFIKRKRLD